MQLSCNDRLLAFFLVFHYQHMPSILWRGYRLQLLWSLSYNWLLEKWVVIQKTNEYFIRSCEMCITGLDLAELLMCMMYHCFNDSLPYLNWYFPTACICTCVCTSHHSKPEPLSTSPFPTSSDFDLWSSIPSHSLTWIAILSLPYPSFFSLLSLPYLSPTGTNNCSPLLNH